MCTLLIFQDKKIQSTSGHLYSFLRIMEIMENQGNNICINQPKEYIPQQFHEMQSFELVSYLLHQYPSEQPSFLKKCCHLTTGS